MHVIDIKQTNVTTMQDGRHESTMPPALDACQYSREVN